MPCFASASLSRSRSTRSDVQCPERRPEAVLGISYRDFIEYRGHNQVFSEMAGNTFHDLTLTGAGEPSIVNAADVTPEIFSVLRARPLAGRLLLPEDGKPGAADVAVVSEDLWRSRFGSNPTPLSESFSKLSRSGWRSPSRRVDFCDAGSLFGPRTSQPGCHRAAQARCFCVARTGRDGRYGRPVRAGLP